MRPSSANKKTGSPIYACEVYHLSVFLSRILWNKPHFSQSFLFLKNYRRSFFLHSVQILAALRLMLRIRMPAFLTGFSEKGRHGTATLCTLWFL